MGWDVQEIVVFLLSTVVIIFLIIILSFFVIFYRKKFELLEENKIFSEKYLKLVNTSMFEIQENTYKSLSFELHDNICQNLSFIKMQLSMQLEKKNEMSKEKVLEFYNHIDGVLSDIRSLMNNINGQKIQEMGLKNVIKNYTDYLKSHVHLHVIYKQEGLPMELSPENELLVFRIIQEFCFNTIKHSNATELSILVESKEDSINFKLKDNGKGYYINEEEKGFGLTSIGDRLKIIRAIINEYSTTNGVYLDFTIQNNVIIE